MLFAPIKSYLKNYSNEYLYSKTRKLEFYFFIFLGLAIFVLQSRASTNTRAILTQLQGFVMLYMAFRFGYLGMTIGIMTTLKDIIITVIIYNKTHVITYFMGAISSTSILLWIIIVGIVSYKREKHRLSMRKLAITDELTEVYNHRYFLTSLDNSMHPSSKAKQVGLILIDIDNFRMYNDLYGHEFGDTILKNTGTILKDIVGNTADVYRFGGDEFAILITNQHVDKLEQFAKKLFSNYESIKKDYYKDTLSDKISISIGLSQYPTHSRNSEELIAQANEALYQTKNMGEDKINTYKDIMQHINTSIKSDQQMIGVFKCLLSSINTKDKYTFGHCERVSSYAVMIGEAIGMDIDEIETLLYAGLLHDIGKIDLPKSILNKIGRLTDEEFSQIRQHSINSAKILEPLSGKKNLIDYVLHHHERFDGKGYPDGLKDNETSLGAKILCVADCFDAMVSDRPYRRSMTVEEAFSELEKCSGTQFDPKIVQYFIKTMRTKMSTKYNYSIENINNSQEEVVDIALY